MNNLNKIESVTERDIDLLLLEEFNVSPEFSSWFHSKVISNASVPEIIGAWHSVSDSVLGESDLIVIYQDQLAVLIENKIDAVSQPNQGERYKQRGAKGIEAKNWKRFISCMIAPNLYLDKEKDSTVYDSTVSYEDLKEWFQSKNNRRSEYKAYLITEAIEKNRRGYTVIPNEAVTDFWFKYWKLSTQKYPELEMKNPGPRPANADWPEFRPSSLEKDVLIFHKLARGYIDLQVAGAANRVEELQDLLANYDVEVVVTGRSASIRLIGTPINRFESFDSQIGKVIEGFMAASKLLEISHKFSFGCKYTKPNLTD